MSGRSYTNRVSDESPVSLSGWLFADLFLLLIVVGFAFFTAGGDDNIPYVETNQATAVTSSSAVLNGTVRAKGEITSLSFEWGRSPLLDDAELIDAKESPVSGREPVNFFAQRIQRLEKNSVYYYRALASSPSGSSKGQILSFETKNSGECTLEGARFEKTPFVGTYTEANVSRMLDEITEWAADVGLADPKVAVAQIKGWTTEPRGAGTAGQRRAREFYAKIKSLKGSSKFFYGDTAVSPFQNSALSRGHFDVELYFVDFAERC